MPYAQCWSSLISSLPHHYQSHFYKASPYTIGRHCRLQQDLLLQDHRA
jgi:hypothetical protein